MKKKRITIKELASATDVHISTVSRVMNPETRHLISDDVVRRVLDTAMKLKYSPNRIAATLRTKRSGTVGVILPDISNPLFPPILRGIEDELAKRGMVSLVAHAGEGKARERFVVDQMIGRQVDGLILATAQRKDPVLDHCLAEGFPIVAVNRCNDSGRVSCVSANSHLASELALDHMVKLGHKRIAHLAGPSSTSTGYERRQGFIESLKAHQLKSVQCPIIEVSAYTREAGRAACHDLLKRYPATTAIVAANDLVALGCYDSFAEAGIHCPKDISVIGHNDNPLMDSISPPLTTIRLPLHKMGVRAAALLMDMLSGQGIEQVNIVLGVEIVVRGSTSACPRS